jgi:hypothetical protein
VKALRSSGQRRDDLRAVIKAGNAARSWGRSNIDTSDLEDGIESDSDEMGAEEEIRVVQLLRDVDTRWSSTFLMVDRLLELYPVSSSSYSLVLYLTLFQAVRRLLRRHKYREISYLALNRKQLQVLSHIRLFLQVAHAVQEVVSAEKTPTLSVVLPLYEDLIDMLKNMKNHLPLLSHSIKVSLAKLREYLKLSRKSFAYILAMGMSIYF